MPQLPQCQMNGNATKPTDKFNISQPAKGAEEEGAALWQAVCSKI